MIFDEERDREFLQHYGVKGMHWGVITKGPSSARPRSISKQKVALNSREKAVLDKLGPHGYTEERMNNMYGPGSLSDDNPQGFHLTSGEKKALIIGGAAVIAGLALYGTNKYMQNLAFKNDFQNVPSSMTGIMRSFHSESVHRQTKGFSKKFVENLSDTPVNLPKGTVLKRVSTMEETLIRPGGFFASAKQSDVERYKAVMPIFWKRAGLKVDSGFVTHLEAQTAIKAPSPKQTFSMFKDILDEEIVDDSGTGRKSAIRDVIRAVRPVLKLSDDEAIARNYFPTAAGQWFSDGNRITKAFFDKVKSSGYNAVSDLNDYGNLSDSPIRVLDGNTFKIVKNEPLSIGAIKEAQEQIRKLAHMIMDEISTRFAIVHGYTFEES